MRAEDIKVGMWVRDPGGDVCKTSRQSEIVRGWHVEYPDGRLHTWPSEQLDPWTPRVGEWVRFTLTGVTRQVISLWESHGTWWSSEDGVYGRVAECEPCLPPAPPTTHLQADGVEVPAKPGGSDVPPMLWKNVGVRRDTGANGTCLKCGGPAYVGLQEARCLAPKCERVEPEPEMLLQPMAKSRNGWRVEDGPLHEDIWIACGRGKEVRHPIREEAIRLWREAVARG